MNSIKFHNLKSPLLHPSYASKQNFRSSFLEIMDLDPFVLDISHSYFEGLSFLYREKYQMRGYLNNGFEANILADPDNSSSFAASTEISGRKPRAQQDCV